MISGISNLSLLTQVTNALTNGQDTLSDLTQQLASGVKSTDLTRYSVYEARTIVNSRDLQNKANGYIAAIKTVEPRLTVYESSLAAIEKLIKTTQSTLLNTQNATAATQQGVAQQVAGVIDQTAYYLNQKVGDRYIFSGTRYNQKPIGDIKALSAPPTETFPATSPTLPPYDAAAPASDANAYAKDRVTIDDTVQVSYGISSTDSAIQNLVQGLRYAYGATQNPSTYQANVDQAQTYLKTALDGVRALRAQVAGNSKLLADSKTSQTDGVKLLQSQLDGIRSVDINDVAVKISSYNSQLQASYSASSKLLDLSILKYLS